MVKIKMPVSTIVTRPERQGDGWTKDDIDAGRTQIVNIRREFAERVNRRLKQLGWTQSELSRRSNLKRDSVSLYCLAKALPTAPSLKLLAEALDCLPGDLLPNYDLHLLEQKSKVSSPIYLDPGRRPDEARITISEWLPLDIAQQIFNLWVEGQKQKAKGDN